MPTFEIHEIARVILNRKQDLRIYNKMANLNGNGRSQKKSENYHMTKSGLSD